MKIDCTVDGKTLTLSLNSNKPLSLILQENLDNQSNTAHCKGRMCGLCAVLIDGKAELSCMVPAFELKGRNIMTLSESKKYANYICSIGNILNHFDRLYPFTTENISGYFKEKDIKNKSILTVGSSGDQAINAFAMGAKEVTIFDINPFT